jgi:hypothetical protein
MILEYISELYPDDSPERIFNIWKANGYIRFYSKKDGFNNTWAGWRAQPPAVQDLPEIQNGSRRDQYSVLVQGTRDARHDWREPLEKSEFLQRLDVRVTETGFNLDVNKGESRFEALNRLRNRMWSITDTEEAKPLIAIKQADGSSLISDRSLFFESARLDTLPKLVIGFIETGDDNVGEICYFELQHCSGEEYCFKHKGGDGEEIYDSHLGDRLVKAFRMMPISDAAKAHAYLCQLVGFEWNTLHALQTYNLDWLRDGEFDFRGRLFNHRKDGQGRWRGTNYSTPAEIEQDNIEEAQRKAEEKAELEAEDKRKEERRIKKIEQDSIIAEQAKSRDNECH